MVTNHNSRDGAQEHRVRGEIRREAVAALEQVPWEHADAHDGGDVASAADILCATIVTSQWRWHCYKTGGRRTIYCGMRAVRSQPALIEFADMFVLQACQ